VPWYIAVPVILAAAYAGGIYIARHSVYFPVKYPEGVWDAQATLGAEDVWMDSAGARIHGWFLANPGSSWVTLHLHGNGGNITHRYPRFHEIRAAGSAVLALDYRGYGRSTGKPSEAGVYSDADAAYGELMRRGYAPEQIVLYGESLGTAVAVDLAARRQCAGLILEAPFSSARDVAAVLVPVLGPLVVWGFDSRAKVASVHVPLFVMHGDRDQVIPLRLGQKLFAAANEPKTFWLVHGAGHNDVAETAGSAYREKLESFYRGLNRVRS